MDFARLRHGDEGRAALDRGVDEEVFADGEWQGEAFFLPAAGDEGDALGDRVGRAARGDGAAVQRDGAGFDRNDAAEGAADTVLPGTAQAGEAEDLTRVERDADGAGVRCAQVVAGEKDVPAVDLRALGHARGGAADDELYKFRRGGFADGARGDAKAVSHDGDAIGQTEDLIHAVADIDHAVAGSAETIEHGEEAGDFRFGQAGSGFVEDDDLGLGGQGAGDGDDGFVGLGKVDNARFCVERASHDVECAASLCVDAAPTDQTMSAWVTGGERDVLGNGHPGDEGEILVDEGDREGVGARIDGTAGGWPSLRHRRCGRRPGP